MPSQTPFSVYRPMVCARDLCHPHRTGLGSTGFTGTLQRSPLTPMVNLNLNGGPSKKAAQLSSLPVASRYGLVCLMSTLLMTLLCPVISPTEEPLSHRKTAPNL